MECFNRTLIAIKANIHKKDMHVIVTNPLICENERKGENEMSYSLKLFFPCLVSTHSTEGAAKPLLLSRIFHSVSWMVTWAHPTAKRESKVKLNIRIKLYQRGRIRVLTLAINIVNESAASGIQLNVSTSTSFDLSSAKTPCASRPKLDPTDDITIITFRPSRSTRRVGNIAPTIWIPPTNIDATFGFKLDPDSSKIDAVKLSMANTPANWFSAIKQMP